MISEPTNDSSNIMCVREGCSNIAQYNYEGTQVAIVCFIHKMKPMLEVTKIGRMNGQEGNEEQMKLDNNDDGQMLHRFEMDASQNRNMCGGKILQNHKQNSSQMYIGGIINNVKDYKSRRPCLKKAIWKPKQVTCEVKGCSKPSDPSLSKKDLHNFCQIHKQGKMKIGKTIKTKGIKAQNSANSSINSSRDDRISLCFHDLCAFLPTFNFQGEHVGVLCSNHKLKGMIEVVKDPYGPHMYEI